MGLTQEYRLLSLTLVTLLFSQWPEPMPGLAQAGLLAHFGLFFLWQRLRCHPRSLALTTWIGWLAFVALNVVFLNAWLLLFWKLALISCFGGRFLSRLRDRWVNRAVLLFLIASLFLVDLNALFKLSLIPAEFVPWLLYGLLSLPVILFWVPVGETTHTRDSLDFLPGLMLCLLVCLIALGSVLSASYAHILYPLAVLGVSLGTGLLILVIVGLWLSVSPYENFQQLWARQSPNSSSTLEQWLVALTQLLQDKSMTHQKFLEVGLERLTELPWICGVGWQSLSGHGARGEEGEHQASMHIQSLEVTLYAVQPISAAHQAQAKLLVQLLEQFHQSKRREETFVQQAHLRAIYETGAKLTHDIKNILQSLYALTSAVETAKPEEFGITQRITQNQLSHLTQRLKRTLDKLGQPSESGYSDTPVRVWWDNLRARHHSRDIHFSASIMWNTNIPEDLFDNVIENLLANALNKRQREFGLSIQVALETSENQVSLSVCDNGSAIADDLEKELLSQPVPSHDGFGIGLYQAAKQSIHSGYRLRVSHNEPGMVCFELASV